MTTPTAEIQQLRPSSPARYEQISQLRLTLAREELDQGDLAQAAEKIWGAIATALKAVAQQRGWNHRFHNHLRAVSTCLSMEWNRPDLAVTFAAIDHLHTNYYEHQLFDSDVRPLLAAAVTYCRDLGQLRRQGEPPRLANLTRRQRADRERLMRVLTMPLHPKVAFGPELTEEEMAALPPVAPGE